MIIQNRLNHKMVYIFASKFPASLLSVLGKRERGGYMFGLKKIKNGVRAQGARLMANRCVYIIPPLLSSV